MKYTFKLFQIVLLICGVFVAEADEVKPVSVMEGESVTLNTDVTETQGIILILWRFGDKGPAIAQINRKDISYPSHTDIFRGKLQLDQTGSLTINNMRTKHSGLYKVQIDLNSGSSRMTFNVTVSESPSVVHAGEAEMKTVSVMEGNSVILQTDVTETHGDELIVWRFGDKGKLIAKHDKEAKSSLLHDTGERLRDRLELDHQTGSLTITHTRTTDSGFYTVKINSNKPTLYKRFIVTVSVSGLSSGAIIGIVVAVLVVAAAAAVIYIHYRRSEREKQIDSIKPETVECEEGKCAVLQSYHEIKKGVQMLWTRVSIKESAVASVSENDKKTYWYDTRFRGRLQLDPHTGSLIIRNLRKTDAGVYFLEIKCRGGIKYRKYKVILSGKFKTETVSVKEGEDVTLSFPGKSRGSIKWTFEEKKGFIASLIINDDSKDNECMYPVGRSVGRFRDRLELDTQTGSLTIKKIRPEHTGLYRVLTDPRNKCKKLFNVVFDDFTETSVNGSVSTGFMGRIQRFCGLARIGGAFGDEKDEMMTMPVMDGCDVNLNTNTKIQPDDEMILRFGTAFRTRCPYITIARFSKPGDEFKSEERGFKNRLSLTGSLTGPLTITITNFKTTDCGDYYVQITNKEKKSFKSFTFIVVPSGDVVKLVSVTKGELVGLEPLITDLEENYQMLWTFGPHGMIIADTTNTSGCDKRFTGNTNTKVTLDETTGSLTIRKSTTEDSGEYNLHIISSNRVIHQRFNVTVEEEDASTIVPISYYDEFDDDDCNLKTKCLGGKSENDASVQKMDDIESAVDADESYTLMD